MPKKFIDCLRLNLRVCGLALRNRWIEQGEVANSYDRLAVDYEKSWLEHLRPVTYQLLERLPERIDGLVFDLGCGTGETTRQLAERYPHAAIRAQDISSGMLSEAQRFQDRPSINYSCGDMLLFLEQQSAESATIVLSAWAIGYSNPSAIIHEAFRVLKPGGRFAFVVNLMDTLRPVYIAFRKTMQRYPDKLETLARPRFPRSWKQVERQALAAGFKTEWHQEDRLPVCSARKAELSWLLNTGILAGFDSMLPLRQNPEVAQYFNDCLQAQSGMLEHHYMMAVFEK